MSDDEHTVVLRIDAGSEALLRSMLDDLDDLVDDPGSAGAEVAQRLVPVAHPDDPLAEDDYRSVVGAQLREERHTAAEIVRRTLDEAAAAAATAVEEPGAMARELFADLSAPARRAGLGARLEVLQEVWDSSPSGSPLRTRVADELVGLCSDGARDAARHDDEDALAFWVGAASRAEWLSVPDGAVEMRLDPDELEAWMKSVNHVRLALGTICGVEEEDEPGWEEDDPRAPLLERYHFLTALLAHLVDLVD